MRNYELMAVVSPELDNQANEATIEQIAKLITDNAGEVNSIDRWGKKRLAYAINHLNEGYYTVFFFTGSNDTVDELNRVMKIREEILRFIVVRRPEEA